MHITRIRRSRGLGRLGLVELWAYRDLFLILAMRDIKVRYKQAALGIGWALIQPIAMATILFLFFGLLMGLNEKVARMPGFAPGIWGVEPVTANTASNNTSAGSLLALACE